MTLKPWRELAVPHEDVLKGKFQQAEFAADLSRVHARSAREEYQDPVRFFERTYITEGMRLLLDSVVRRLAGRGGDPVIQLQTAFGGGKTHTMLAVYHLARGEVAPGELPGIAPILDAAGIVELPPARIAVIDGIKASPSQPTLHDGTPVHTLWGDLAWQLGQADAYAKVADADRTGTSPGKAVLEDLLRAHAPCVILIDELVAYMRQFEDGQSLPGGTFDSNLTFVQALTEAIKGVPDAVLLASLPQSDKEAGTQRGARAMASLAHYFGRVQALWKPVAAEEAFEIVRRRLFTRIDDRPAADAVCRAYADLYLAHKDDLPRETQEARYLARLREAYPIHPEVFDRLYDDWSTLDNFQRTRGVLKLMAKVIHRLWKDGNNDLMIMPGSLPLYDADTRNEVIYHLPPGWDPVIERDVDGERAETTAIENQDTRFGAVQACRRSARTIFLGSAPSTNSQVVRGLELDRVVLGVLQPGQQPGTFKDALRRLGERLHYLNSGNERLWFDTRPNLRREMEDRKRRYQDREHVQPVVEKRLRESIGAGAFGAVHVFAASGDIPDDTTLRLVVLSPEASYGRSGVTKAIDSAIGILEQRGDAPRQMRNRLLFLAADQDHVARLRDQVRSLLAWQSIVADAREGGLNLDAHQARQAGDSMQAASDALRRMVRETYRWLLAPGQEARPGKSMGAVTWEPFALNTGAAQPAQEIERVLRDNELVVAQWAPVHLREMLKTWFWRDGTPAANAIKVWEDTCKYLYLPRLQNRDVLRTTIEAGVSKGEFFGLAQAMEGDGYAGFVHGQATTVVLDGTLVLIEPSAAAAYTRGLEEKSPAPSLPGGTRPDTKPGSGPSPPPPPPPTRTFRRFHGAVDVDALRAKAELTKVLHEVVELFTAKPNVRVRLTLEVEADAEGAAFDSDLRRSIVENCDSLKFKAADFEGD